MRLIDADALKKAACVKFYTTPYYKHILDLIDKAPIEPNRFDEGYALGYKDGYLKGKEARPQGHFGSFGR